MTFLEKHNWDFEFLGNIESQSETDLKLKVQTLDLVV